MLIERMMLLKRAVYTLDESKNSRFLILCFVEIIGIAIGSYLAVHYESNEFLRKYFCAELYGGKALEIFGSSVLILTIFLGTAFFLGLFALGQPLGIVLLMCMGETWMFYSFAVFRKRDQCCTCCAFALFTENCGSICCSFACNKGSFSKFFLSAEEHAWYGRSAESEKFLHKVSCSFCRGIDNLCV